MLGILGLGITGTSLVSYCKKNNINFIAWDDNKPELSTPNPKLEDITILVVSPGINSSHPLIKKLQSEGVTICSDIEYFYKLYNCQEKIISITGTNGKSTTTALINYIINYTGKLKSAIGGNFGIPIFDLNPEEYDFLVLELSSFQLDRIKEFASYISILINITPDHIDYHGSIENYIAAKRKIFSNCNHPIICTDSKYSAELAEHIPNITKISRNNAPQVKNIRLQGEHNKENIICAVTAAKLLDIEDNVILEALESFEGLEHRMEYVADMDGVKYINDSKATNFDSSKYALSAFNNIHWIIGGISKEDGIKGFEEYIDHIKSIYILGQCQQEFSDYIGDKADKYLCDDLNKAVSLAKHNAVKGDVVLLSPACSSLDQWKNYEERGRAFKKYVRE